ncbi:E3 ubiquitin-protein ligase [Aphelenchoides besseyi]|nr:E3 ubiquitin-protein ligase [Aphelenchoides besseyi]
MRLEVTSLALPPIGTGGFHLDRTLCANALSDALQSINDFRRLNRISIIDTNRNMVGFFHERMSQLVTRDHHQNPQHYPTLHLQPFARSSQSQTQATGNGSSNLFVNAINVQPLPLSILPFSSYFTALSKQRIADLRAARLEEIEREKDQNKEQPSDIVEACPVCLMEMYEEDMTSYSENDDMTVVQLGKCSHCFHRSCVITWFRNQVKCPLCQTEMTATLGPQPSDGRMVSEICTRGRLDGYEDVYGFIKINYSFPNGIQTDQHLRPGVPYTGTHRECYLPNTYEGDVVLRLLQVAFNRGHIFTVGDSITSGQRNTVVWNGIHHKTSRHGGPAAYGYPDPGYLNRVKNELAAVGVTQDDIDTDDSMDDSYTDEDD